MPFPVYIICSESGSLDKLSNSVSIYNIIEKIAFAQPEDIANATTPVNGKPLMQIRMTAAWRPDVTEAGSTFEHQALVRVPGQANPIIFSEGSFVFKRAIHRFIAEMGGFPVGSEGTLLVEHKIRELGQDEWISQSYEIPVTRMTLTPKRELPGD